MSDPHDVFQALRPFIPSAVGVICGVLARWGREVKEGRAKSPWRRLVCDVPTLGALTLIAAMVAEQMQAGPLMTSAIGTAFGYGGMHLVDLVVARYLARWLGSDAAGPR
jgi:hypothetical protein